jgi:hypothetical protein
MRKPREPLAQHRGHLGELGVIERRVQPQDERVRATAREVDHHDHGALVERLEVDALETLLVERVRHGETELLGQRRQDARRLAQQRLDVARRALELAANALEQRIGQRRRRQQRANEEFVAARRRHPAGRCV